jgi:hypothetical protein
VKSTRLRATGGIEASRTGTSTLARMATDRHGRLLMAALGFAGLRRPSRDRALHALRSWLDSWSGIGHIAVGMHRQGFDLQLTQYDERGWRATSDTSGMEDSPTSAASDPTGTIVTPIGLTAVLSLTDSSVVFRPKTTARLSGEALKSFESSVRVVLPGGYPNRQEAVAATAADHTRPASLPSPVRPTHP